MTDYEKFAIRAMDIANERGVDTSDPDAVEPVAKAVAEEYVLDEETLVELVRQRAGETEHIGNIYEEEAGAEEISASVLLEQAREWAEEADLSARDVDWDARSFEEGEQPSEHDFTAWRRDTDDGDETEPEDDQ